MIIEIGQWKVYLLQTDSGNLVVCPYKPSTNSVKCVDILIKPDLTTSINGIQFKG